MSAPGATPLEALAEHGAFLRRLARSLVGGDAEADDLVQETFAIALEKPPEAGPSRAWLRVVLRSVFLMRLRGARRRTARELLVATEGAAPSAEALLGRLELQRLVAGEVATLPEPLRQTVLLRYVEGLSSAEIARALGVPAGTVRWRLKEGLDRLRARLDAETPGGRRAWCVLLAPLGRSPGAGTTTLTTGGVIVAKKTGLAALVILLLALGGVALVRLRGAPEVHPAAPAQLVRPAAPAPPRAPAVERGALPEETAERKGPRVRLGAPVVVDDPAALSGAFSGQVVNWGTGRAVRGAEVTFSLEGATRSVLTDADGRFHHAPERLGLVRLETVTAAGFLPFAPELGASPIALRGRAGKRVEGLVIYLSPAIDYEITVRAEDGAAVAGAEMRLVGAGAGEQTLLPLADRFVTDAAGKAIVHAPDLALFEARHPQRGVGRGSLDGPALTSHKLEIRLSRGARSAAARIAGRVLGPDTQPVPGATVQATPDRRPGEHDRDRPWGQATTDGEGRFVVEGLDEGAAYTLEARHELFAPGRSERTAGGAQGVLVRLGRGRSLRGRVVDADGRPAAAYTLALARKRGLAFDVVRTLAIVDAEGRFAVEGLEPGRYRIVATGLGRAPSAALDAEAPADGLELRLGKAGTVVGVVTDAAGKPLEHAKVQLEGDLSSGSIVIPLLPAAITDEEGRFELAGVPPGRRSVVVGAFDHHARIVPMLDVTAGGTVGPITVKLTKVAAGEQPGIDLVGIGAKLRASEDAIVIDGLVPGGGAAEVGLGAGDAILSVEGEPVSSLGMGGTIARIRGAEGTTVRLGVRKAGQDRETLIDVPRRRLRS